VSEGLSLRSARIAQVVWLVLAGATTAAYAVPVAVQWAALQTICRPVSACLSFQLDAASARTLSQHGISMGAFAVFTAAAYAVLWVIWYAPAALIIWRKPQDRGALVCAFFLVSFPALVAAWGGFIPASAPGILQLPLNVVPFAALLLFGLLFPDGRFIPLWTRWLIDSSPSMPCRSVACTSIVFHVAHIGADSASPHPVATVEHIRQVFS